MRWRLSVAVAAVSLTAYVLTLSPTVGPVDSGELTLAAYHLDIAHPPGFPLYTLLAWATTRLVPGSPARAANLLSAICAAVAAGALASLLTRFVRLPMACAAAALCFALGRTAWSWSTVAEVYSLQSLLLALILLAAVRVSSSRLRILAGYLVGLSLANHIGTAAAVLPALALMVPLLGLAVPVACAILGISVYAYLPLRCLAGPLFNWGNPCSLRRFVWHITGKQYQVNFSLNPAGMLEEVEAFWRALSEQYPVWILPAVGAGQVLLARRQKRIAYGLAVLVLGNLLYCAMYQIGQDKDAYYIPAFMAMAIPLGIAVEAVISRIPRRLAAVALVVPAIIAIRNLDSQNRRGFALAESYARDALQSVGPKGLLLTTDWQVFAPTLYLQEVEGESPGVVSVDVLLLKRTWYLDYLARRWPALLAATGRSLTAYRALLHRFEYGLSYDPGAIQRSYVNLINALAQASVTATGGPSHLMGPMDQGVGAGWGAVPRGIVERLVRLGERVPYEEVRLRLDVVTGDDPSRTEVGNHIRGHYARALLRQAAVLRSSGAIRQAEQKEQLARQLSPHPTRR